MAAPLSEPLLPDVEKGKPDDKKEEERTEMNAEEADELNKEGAMSIFDLIQFFTDPSHWIVTALCAYAVMALFGCIYFSYAWGNFDVFHHIGIAAVLASAGLGGAAYSSFLGEQLKVEVNKFWQLNNRLNKNKARLEGTCQELRENVEKMHEQVEGFKKVQEQMKGFQNQATGSFAEVLKQAKEVMSKMEGQLKDNMSDTLSNYAQSFEFLDGEEGLDKDEFEKFKMRLPPDFKNVSFEEAAKGKDAASFEDIQELIDKAAKSLVKEGGSASSA